MKSANNNIPKQKTKRKISFLPKEIAESGRPEVNLLTKVLMAVTASLSLLAAFLPFIPIPFEEKYVTETTITNMIGIVGKDLGTDTFRTSGAVFLTIFFVAIVFVAIGVVGILYRDRIAAFFTLCGTGVLVYFSASWLSSIRERTDNPPAVPQGQPVNVTKESLASLFSKTAIPYLVIVFAGMAAVASVALIFIYKAEEPKTPPVITRNPYKLGRTISPKNK